MSEVFDKWWNEHDGTDALSPTVFRSDAVTIWNAALDAAVARAQNVRDFQQREIPGAFKAAKAVEELRVK